MKIGIVGSGMITKVMLDLWKRYDEIEVTAMYCREVDFERGKELQKDYGFASVYTDYDEFLKDESFEFAYIGLVNKFHYEYSKKALLAGRASSVKSR